MVLCLFRLGYYILGIPLESSERLRHLDKFRLTPSGIHPTIWKFQNTDKEQRGHFLHFPRAVGNPLTDFRHSDRLIYCNEEDNFMVLLQGYVGMIRNINLDELRCEPYHFVEKGFNHFVRFFLKKTVFLNNNRVFLIEPETIYAGYEHVLEDV